MPGPPAGDVVQAHLAAFSAGDLPAMLATMAPDAVFVSGTTLVPPQDFEEFFGWAMREIDPLIEVTNLVQDGRHVACQFVESVTLDGERKHLNRASFYIVDDGVITSAKVYDERD
jgi:ketosteroid isomerase-like protein